MTSFLFGLLLGFMCGLVAMGRSLKQECESSIVKFGESFYKTTKMDKKEILR